MTKTDWDVTSDEGFAAFFAATFDTAYAYAAHLCGNDRADAEALVRLVYGFAHRHARDGRVATLSAAAMRSAITNAWRDTQGDPDAPLPTTEPSRIGSENTPRHGLYEALFAELVGARINPWAADPDTTVAIAADPEHKDVHRRVCTYRAAAYAVLAGVVVFVLAITLRDSESSPTVTTTATTTATSSSSTATTDSTSTTDSTATTSTTPSTSTASSTTPGATLEP